MVTKELRIGKYISLGNRITKAGEIYYKGILTLEETQDTIEELDRVKKIQLI